MKEISRRNRRVIKLPISRTVSKDGSKKKKLTGRYITPEERNNIDKFEEVTKFLKTSLKNQEEDQFMKKYIKMRKKREEKNVFLRSGSKPTAFSELCDLYDERGYKVPNYTQIFKESLILLTDSEMKEYLRDPKNMIKAKKEEKYILKMEKRIQDARMECIRNDPTKRKEIYIPTQISIPKDSDNNLYTLSKAKSRAVLITENTKLKKENNKLMTEVEEEEKKSQSLSPNKNKHERTLSTSSFLNRCKTKIFLPVLKDESLKKESLMSEQATRDRMARLQLKKVSPFSTVSTDSSPRKSLSRHLSYKKEETLNNDLTKKIKAFTLENSKPNNLEFKKTLAMIEKTKKKVLSLNSKSMKAIIENSNRNFSETEPKVNIVKKLEKQLLSMDRFFVKNISKIKFDD